MSTQVARSALRWAALVVAWFVLATTVSVAESIAAVVAATLVLVLGTRLARRVDLRVEFRAQWFVHLVKVPGQVAQDLGVLAAHLVRRPGQRGVFRAVPFPNGTEQPDDVARRALITAAASLGPNTFVLAWDREHEVVLVHQLERSPRVLPTQKRPYP